VEIQRNRVRGRSRCVAALLDIANDAACRRADGNVFYHAKPASLVDVMVAIRHRTTLDGSHRARNPNSEFYLRPEDVVSLFVTSDAVATTCQAERCKVSTDARPRVHLPRFPRSGSAPAPQAIGRAVAREMQEAIRRAPSIMPRPWPADDELRLSSTTKLSGFFLVATTSSILPVRSPPNPPRHPGARAICCPGRGRAPRSLHRVSLLAVPSIDRKQDLTRRSERRWHRYHRHQSDRTLIRRTSHGATPLFAPSYRLDASAENSACRLQTIGGNRTGSRPVRRRRRISLDLDESSMSGTMPDSFRKRRGRAVCDGSIVDRQE